MCKSAPIVVVRDEDFFILSHQSEVIWSGNRSDITIVTIDLILKRLGYRVVSSRRYKYAPKIGSKLKKLASMSAAERKAMLK